MISGTIKEFPDMKTAMSEIEPGRIAFFHSQPFTYATRNHKGILYKSMDGRTFATVLTEVISKDAES